MASSRAEVVAEILFELKRAGKIATYTNIARRLGFSAGSNGRVMDSCLKVVRRDWPHLHWWRAIKDDGLLDSGSEQAAKLKEGGYEVEETEGGKRCTVISLQSHLMVWEPVPTQAARPAAEATEAAE